MLPFNWAAFLAILLLAITVNAANLPENVFVDENAVVGSQEYIQAIKNLHRRTKRSKGFARGQTQSQYLNFGKPEQDGKAEAEASETGSRSTVSGTHGMGQAQSQFSSSGCGDCDGSLMSPDPYRIPVDVMGNLKTPGIGRPGLIDAGRTSGQFGGTGPEGGDRTRTPGSPGPTDVGSGGYGRGASRPADFSNVRPGVVGPGARGVGPGGSPGSGSFGPSGYGTGGSRPDGFGPGGVGSGGVGPRGVGPGGVDSGRGGPGGVGPSASGIPGDSSGSNGFAPGKYGAGGSRPSDFGAAGARPGGIGPDSNRVRPGGTPDTSSGGFRPGGYSPGGSRPGDFGPGGVGHLTSNVGPGGSPGADSGGFRPGGYGSGGSRNGDFGPSGVGGGAVPGGVGTGGIGPGGIGPGGIGSVGNGPGGISRGGIGYGGSGPGGIGPGGSGPGGSGPGGSGPGGIGPGGIGYGGSGPGGIGPGGSGPGGSRPGGIGYGGSGPGGIGPGGSGPGGIGPGGIGYGGSGPGGIGPGGSGPGGSGPGGIGPGGIGPGGIGPGGIGSGGIGPSGVGAGGIGPGGFGPGGIGYGGSGSGGIGSGGIGPGGIGPGGIGPGGSGPGGIGPGGIGSGGIGAGGIGPGGFGPGGIGSRDIGTGGFIPGNIGTGGVSPDGVSQGGIGPNGAGPYGRGGGDVPNNQRGTGPENYRQDRFGISKPDQRPGAGGVGPGNKRIGSEPTGNGIGQPQLTRVAPGRISTSYRPSGMDLPYSGAGGVNAGATVPGAGGVTTGGIGPGDINNLFYFNVYKNIHYPTGATSDPTVPGGMGSGINNVGINGYDRPGYNPDKNIERGGGVNAEYPHGGAGSTVHGPNAGDSLAPGDTLTRPGGGVVGGGTGGGYYDQPASVGGIRPGAGSGEPGYGSESGVGVRPGAGSSPGVDYYDTTAGSVRPPAGHDGAFYGPDNRGSSIPSGSLIQPDAGGRPGAGTGSGGGYYNPAAAAGAGTSTVQGGPGYTPDAGIRQGPGVSSGRGDYKPDAAGTGSGQGRGGLEYGPEANGSLLPGGAMITPGADVRPGFENGQGRGYYDPRAPSGGIGNGRPSANGALITPGGGDITGGGYYNPASDGVGDRGSRTGHVGPGYGTVSGVTPGSGVGSAEGYYNPVVDGQSAYRPAAIIKPGGGAGYYDPRAGVGGSGTGIPGVDYSVPGYGPGTAGSLISGASPTGGLTPGAGGYYDSALGMPDTSGTYTPGGALTRPGAGGYYGPSTGEGGLGRGGSYNQGNAPISSGGDIYGTGVGGGGPGTLTGNYRPSGPSGLTMGPGGASGIGSIGDVNGNYRPSGPSGLTMGPGGASGIGSIGDINGNYRPSGPSGLPMGPGGSSRIGSIGDVNGIVNAGTLDSSGTDDAFSQAESTIKDGQAAASAMGKKNGGTAKTQVSGTYTSSGTFSASAMTSDADRAANAQVSGSNEGTMTQSQGQGGAAQSQSQVQVNAKTGGTKASSQSGGIIHQSQSEVQANDKGGLADSQSSGPGQTSSQAQIGFKPKEDNEENLISSGGGQASAQSSSHSGQSQSQIQGQSRYGISYHGAAQSASGTKEQVETYREQNRQLFQSISDFGNTDGIVDKAESAYGPSDNLPSNDVQLRSSSKSKDEKIIPHSSSKDSDDASDEVEEEYEYEDEEDYNFNENAVKMEQKSIKPTTNSTEKPASLNKVLPNKTQTQKAAVADPKDKFSLIQKQNGKTVNYIPRTTTESVPSGFRGTVNVEKKIHTKALDSDPDDTETDEKPKKKLPGPDSYVTVTKSVTGSMDTSKNPPKENKNFQSTYYTKSSTCGYFTFSCNIVYGANGRSKICKPKAPTNGKC